jgi:hypothetical protein
MDAGSQATGQAHGPRVVFWSKTNNKHHQRKAKAMKLSVIKTYSNGCTQSTIITDRGRNEVASHIAKIDAEDAEAGLYGTWTVEVR